jgi:hypothetical protein
MPRLQSWQSRLLQRLNSGQNIQALLDFSVHQMEDSLLAVGILTWTAGLNPFAYLQYYKLQQ